MSLTAIDGGSAGKRAACSDAEWRARVDLAALFRILAHYGMSDLANGAVCARVPDAPDLYLVHPYGMFWEEARASDMVKIAAAGQPIDDGAPWLNDGVQNLCQWIFGSRPDAHFFVHGHEEEIMAVGSIEDGLLPLNQPAVYLSPYHRLYRIRVRRRRGLRRAFRGAARRQSDPDQPQSRLLRARRHGRGRLLPRLFPASDLCDADQDAVDGSANRISWIPQKVARYQDQMAASEHYNYNGATEWPGLIRLLEKRDSSYRD